jgi:hypothetical protein
MFLKKKTAHIVYALPEKRNLFIWLSRLLIIVFKKKYFEHQSYMFKWILPIHALLSITFYLIKSLEKHHKIKLYDFRDKRTLKLNQNDIFIGHAAPDFSTKLYKKNKWTSFDTNQITNKVVLTYPNDQSFF